MPRREAMEKRYTVNEIAQAANLTKSTVVYRIKRLGCRRTGDGYTYDDVKRIVDYRPRRGRNSDQGRAALLRRALLDDGKV